MPYEGTYALRTISAMEVVMPDEKTIMQWPDWLHGVRKADRQGLPDEQS